MGKNNDNICFRNDVDGILFTYHSGVTCDKFILALDYFDTMAFQFGSGVAFVASELL